MMMMMSLVQLAQLDDDVEVPDDACELTDGLCIPADSSLAGTCATTRL